MENTGCNFLIWSLELCYIEMWCNEQLLTWLNITPLWVFCKLSETKNNRTYNRGSVIKIITSLCVRVYSFFVSHLDCLHVMMKVDDRKRHHCSVMLWKSVEHNSSARDTRIGHYCLYSWSVLNTISIICCTFRNESWRVSRFSLWRGCVETRTEHSI